MAAPATAPTKTDLQKRSDAQFNSVLDAAVEIVKIRRASRDKELTSLLGSQRSLDKAIGEGQNNAFVKLADVNNRYARIAAGGQVQPQDKLKYLIQVMELQAEIDRNGRRPNSNRIQRLAAQSGVTSPADYRKSEIAARLWQNYLTEVADAPYDPTLLGDVQDLIAKTGFDLAAVQALPGGAEVVDQYVTRENAATSLSAAADAIRQAFGPDALKTMGAQLAGGSGGIAAAETSMARIPDDVYDAVRVQAGMLPGLGDLQARRATNEDRIKVLRGALDEDPATEVTSVMSGFQSASARADADFKSVSFKARLMGQPKFHEWAKSNGFTVGYARKADQPGDKDLPGYDSATNTVYVPGLDDERAFRAAARQAAMGPRAQALPSFMQGVRGRLPERKNLTVEVEAEASPDLAKKNDDGKFRTVDGRYATDAEIQAVRDANTVTATARVGDKTIVLMKDNSKSILNADGSTTPIAAGDTTYADAVFSKLPNPDVPSDAALAITEAPVPPPAKTRTIVGRETALLPSDPQGATVIETTEGRRIVIPKEKIVSSRDYKEGDVTSGTGTPLEGETGARGIRAPFAAARARMGGLPAVEAATPPEITPQAAAVRRVVTPTVAAPIPAPVSSEVAGAPGMRARVAPTAVAPIPAPSVTVTPGQEAGAEVREAAPSSKTGGNAPQPVQPAGGTPSKVPVLAGRTIGAGATPPIPLFGQVAPDVAPSLPFATMPNTSMAPSLFGTKNIDFENVAPAAAPAPAPAAAAAPAPEEDIFPDTTITLEPEEVPTVAAPDTAALKSRLDTLRRMRAEREAARQQALSAGVFSP